MARHADAEVAAVHVDVTAKAQPRRRVWPLSELGLRSAVAAAALVLVDWSTVFVCLVTAWGLAQLAAVKVAPLSTFMLTFFGLAPWTLAFAAARLYTRRALFWDEARRVLTACSVASLVAVALALNAQLSPLVVVGTWLLAMTAVPLMRYRAKRLLIATGLWTKRVLIVGAGDTGQQVLSRIRASPDLGYEPMAYIDDDTSKIGSYVEGVPVRGPLETLPHAIRELDIKDIVVAVPQLPRERLLHLLAGCEGHVDSIRLVPDLFGLASIGVEAEDFDGVLLLHMRWNLAKPWNLLVKRGFDVLVAAVALVLFAPFAAVIALAVRLDSPGPVFFWQERLGRGLRLFRCVKFRTMHMDNAERLRAHLATDATDRDEWERFRKLRSFDPRVTTVGRVLRRLSLDELPQLVNVLRNEMSLVGPRPYLPEEAERMGDFRETVVKAPPGLTGLWQVSGRNHLTFDQRLRLDEYYVRNWSLWMDCVVLLKTITAVLHRHGAY